MIYLRMGKTTETKPHRVILRSPLPRIHYYQSQTVTSIGDLTKPFSLSRNTNLQLNHFPNTQLDLYCSGNLFLDARIQVHDKLQQLEEVVGCKVLQFINNEDQEAHWSQNPWRKDEVASFRENKTLGHFLHA